MKTDALISALRENGIDPAAALRLFSSWLESTALELTAQNDFDEAENLRYLAGHLHANAKALETEAQP